MLLDEIMDNVETDVKDRLEADLTHIAIGSDNSTSEAEDNTDLDEEFLDYFGDATSQFDVTNPGGSTMRVEWDGNGTDPNFVTNGLGIGDIVRIKPGGPFHSDNEGDFEVTDVGEPFIEVTNGSVQVESDIVLGDVDVIGMSGRKALSWSWDAGNKVLSADATWDQSEGNGITVQEFGVFDAIDLDETMQIREVIRDLAKDNSIYLKVELEIEIMVSQ